MRCAWFGLVTHQMTRDGCQRRHPGAVVVEEICDWCGERIYVADESGVSGAAGQG